MTTRNGLAAVAAFLLGGLALGLLALSVANEAAEMEPELRYYDEHDQ